jgi:hypothetical protein
MRIADRGPESPDRSPNHPADCAATAAAETGGTHWAFQKPQFSGNPSSVILDSAATPGFFLDFRLTRNKRLIHFNRSIETNV